MVRFRLRATELGHAQVVGRCRCQATSIGQYPSASTRCHQRLRKSRPEAETWMSSSAAPVPSSTAAQTSHFLEVVEKCEKKPVQMHLRSVHPCSCRTSRGRANHALLNTRLQHNGVENLTDETLLSDFGLRFVSVCFDLFCFVLFCFGLVWFHFVSSLIF